MSWYEWWLYQKRLEVRQEKEKFDIENGWNQTRIIWATLMNVNRGKNSPAVRPQDLIKLSFDEVNKQEATTEPLTDKQIKEKFGTKLFKK